MIYFVSDLHFGHKNLMKYEFDNRGSKVNTHEEFDELMIKEWNKIITNEDIIYNLGDFFFSCNKQRMQQILNQLNFKQMIFIIGNHDTSDAIKLLNQNGIETKYADVIKNNGIKYYLSHFPTQIDTKNYINLHGHVHSNDTNIENCINISYDSIGPKYNKIALSFKDIENIANKKNLI